MRHIIILVIGTLLFLSCSAKFETIKVELISYQQQLPHNKPITYLQKAYSFYVDDNFDSTLVYCHKSYAESSQDWELYYLYGKTAFKTREYNLADRYLYISLTLCKSQKNDRAKIYFALAENEDCLGRPKLAKQHYLMVTQLDAGSEIAEKAFKKMQLLSKAE